MIANFLNINNEGFTALIVGGAVRDSILGIDPEDFDVEVYGCTIDTLEAILIKYGKIDLIGKSFGILNMENKFDFSIPRKENRIGIKHQDFQFTFDINITFEEAASRRDFTFNSLAYNPLTNELLDYFGGVNDINNKIIRHTSTKFNEDPLRVLRAIQFQSRLGFTIAPETICEMKKMVPELSNLPVERISKEMMKWATKGNHPELLVNFINEIF